LLFNIRPVRDLPGVKREIYKLLEKQKAGTWDDLSPFRDEIEDLLSQFSEFNPSWRKNPAVFRIVRVKAGGENRVYIENVELPNTKHDIDLVLKMLNHVRKEKGFAEVKMPLFVQPDEIALAHQAGRIDFEVDSILSQLAIVFQKGTIILVGFVFGRNFVLLEN
jgi:hypothetical protein